MTQDDDIKRELQHARSELERVAAIPDELPQQPSRSHLRLLVLAASLALAASTVAVVSLTAEDTPSSGSFVGDVPLETYPPALSSVEPGRGSDGLESHQPTASQRATSSPAETPAPVVDCEVGPRDQVDPPTQVSVEIAVQPSRIESGGEVTLQLRVRNNGLTPVEYQHSSKEFDFLVFDSRGEPVWAWGHGKVIQLYQAEATLMPQEEVVIEERWSLNRCGDSLDGDPVGPGEYTVQGYFVAGNDENWWSPSIPLTIEDTP